MAVYDTVENGRSWMTEKTLESLANTVDWSKHRLIVVDNDSCETTKNLLVSIRSCRRPFDPSLSHPVWMAKFGRSFSTIDNVSNIGTARAINRAWSLREPGEHCLKCDNDWVVDQSGWLDKLEACIAAEPRIGVIGLKRGDLAEWPHRQAGQSFDEYLEYKSHLIALPHVYRSGEPWLVVERVKHCIGTCQLYSSALLDKIGYLYQMGGLYGLDDSLAAVRCHVAGFWNCFYFGAHITHIDPGNSDFTTWKQEYAGKYIERFRKTRDEYLAGTRPIWQGVDDE